MNGLFLHFSRKGKIVLGMECNYLHKNQYTVKYLATYREGVESRLSRLRLFRSVAFS